jgi:4-oxalocrotonate tautomerase
MPLVQIKGVSGYLSKEQKSELIRKVTDAVLSVEGEGLRPVTWVLVEDVPEGQWGVGGQSATARMLSDMAGQQPVAR